MIKLKQILAFLMLTLTSFIACADSSDCSSKQYPACNSLNSSDCKNIEIALCKKREALFDQYKAALAEKSFDTQQITTYLQQITSLFEAQTNTTALPQAQANTSARQLPNNLPQLPWWQYN